MKKAWLILLVFTALSLVCPGAAMAAPFSPSGEGPSLFVDYENGYYDSFSAGAGYGFGENLTIGAFYLIEDGFPGVYANLALGPVRFDGELAFAPSETFGFFSALYALKLDPVTLGLGLGTYYDSIMSGPGPEFVGALELNMKPLSIFAGFHSPIGSGNLYFKAGATLTF